MRWQSVLCSLCIHDAHKHYSGLAGVISLVHRIVRIIMCHWTASRIEKYQLKNKHIEEKKTIQMAHHTHTHTLRISISNLCMHGALKYHCMGEKIWW